MRTPARALFLSHVRMPSSHTRRPPNPWHTGTVRNNHATHKKKDRHTESQAHSPQAHLRILFFELFSGPSFFLQSLISRPLCVVVLQVTTHPLHSPLCRNHLNRNDTVGDILFATVLSCLCPPMTSSFLRLLLQHRATRTSPRLHHQQMLPASWKEICGNALPPPPPPLLGKPEGSCQTYRCMYPVLMECLLLLRQSAQFEIVYNSI